MWYRARALPCPSGTEEVGASITVGLSPRASMPIEDPVEILLNLNTREGPLKILEESRRFRVPSNEQIQVSVAIEVTPRGSPHLGGFHLVQSCDAGDIAKAITSTFRTRRRFSRAR